MDLAQILYEDSMYTNSNKIHFHRTQSKLEFKG